MRLVPCHAGPRRGDPAPLPAERAQGQGGALLRQPARVGARAGRARGSPPPLCELPTVVLSNTWFGDPITGELCYSLKTKVLRQIDMVENRASHGRLPRADPQPGLRRPGFPAHLHPGGVPQPVPRARRRLWTNQVEVQFHGEDLNSTIITGRGGPRISSGPPKALRGPRADGAKPAEEELLLPEIPDGDLEEPEAMLHNAFRELRQSVHPGGAAEVHPGRRSSGWPACSCCVSCPRCSTA